VKKLESGKSKVESGEKGVAFWLSDARCERAGNQVTCYWLFGEEDAADTAATTEER
jgi:hypothetical protein